MVFFRKLLTLCTPFEKCWARKGAATLNAAFCIPDEISFFSELSPSEYGNMFGENYLAHSEL